MIIVGREASPLSRSPIIRHMPIRDPQLRWPGKRPPAKATASLRLVEHHGDAKAAWANRLIHGDNLAAMRALARDFTGAVDLIYLDPPFATGEGFHLNGKRHGASPKAYADTWGRGLAGYLQMLYERLVLAHKLLAQTGSLWLHIDWRAGHHARLILDEIFGRENFRNMVVWHYGGRGAKAVSGQFPRNYDLLLYYAKSPAAPFRKAHRIERVPLAEAPSIGIRKDAQGRWFKTSPRGDYTDESVAALDSKGRVHRTRTGSLRIKYFIEAENGHLLVPKLVGDVWDDVPDMMHAPMAERTGYPTQKPLALLSRIIESCTNPGDLVADLFCGSGTTLLAAEQSGRRWLGCDQSAIAVKTAVKRLEMLPGHIPFALYRTEA